MAYDGGVPGLGWPAGGAGGAGGCFDIRDTSGSGDPKVSQIANRGLRDAPEHHDLPSFPTRALTVPVPAEPSRASGPSLASLGPPQPTCEPPLSDRAPSAIAPESVHDVLRDHLLVDGFDLVLDTVKSQGSWLVDARDGTRYLLSLIHI